MKNTIKKIFASLILFILMLNSSFLLVISTAIDAIEGLIDESKVDAIIDINLEKYVNYNISQDEKGVLLQFNIKTGIGYGENQEYVPIKATKTLVNMPQINGKYPEEVNMLAESTKATNGDNKGKDMYYSYNKENGVLEVLVDNKENGDGDIYTENVDGARDEFVVIAKFGAEAYNDQKEERNLNVTGKIEEVLTDDNSTKIDNDFEMNFKVSENISGLISTNVTTNEIYNGFINSNKENGTQSRTEYTENIDINVSYTNISDEVTVETNNKFINNKNEEIETQDLVYKSTKINKQNILNILGDDGKFQILNLDGQVLVEINKDTEAGKDGTLEINYETEQNEIIIKTTKPVRLGTINIKNNKAIKEIMTDIANNKIAIKNIIKCVNNIQEKDEETQEIIREYTEEVYNFENTKEIEIKQSQTKVDVKLDKTQWTNNVQNEVVFTAILVTKGQEYNLFKNPVIDIKLPVEVEKVILGQVALLYDNNLSIKNSNVVNSGENKIIRVELNGNQQDYVTSDMYDGAEVLIPATIILKKDASSNDTNINITYSNETGIINDYVLENKESKIVDLKVVNQNIANYQDVAINEGITNEETTEEKDEIDASKIKTEITATVGNKVLEDNDIVYEQEVITYTYKITNNTGKPIYNLKTSANVPEGTVYVTKDGSFNVDDGGEFTHRNDLFKENKNIKEVTMNVDSLMPDQTLENTFLVRVEKLEDQKEISFVTKAYTNNREIVNKQHKLIAKDAQMKVEIFPADVEFALDTINMKSYTVSVYNLTDKDINDAVLEIKLPEEMTFYDLKGLVKSHIYDEVTRILTVEMSEALLVAQSHSEIILNIAADNLKENVYEYNISIYGEVYTKTNPEIRYRSNTDDIKVYSPGIQVVQSSETEGEDLQSGQEIQYKIEVTNIGKNRALINIIDNLPEGIIPIEAIYESYERTEDGLEYEKVVTTQDMTSKIGDDDLNIDTYVYPEETINVIIKAKADNIDTFLEVENIVTVTGENLPTKISNGIKNRILPWGYSDNPDIDNPDIDNPDIDNPDIDKPDIDDPDIDNPDINKTYNISGIAWLDYNKNSQRDSDEKLLEGITVKLFNAETNSIVTDNNGNAKKTVTSSDGKYSFENIEKGKYLVLFEYDINKYDLVSYKKQGINEALNSDVILKEVSIDGIIKNVGVTDILEITDEDINNIDIGLMDTSIFDVSIEKYVSKISVENSQGTKEYNYNKSKLAKVEIPAKLITSSKIIVEYILVITNNGNTDAYITEILDKVPEELTYEDTLNPDWDNSGKNAINKSLAGQKIKAGETKELTIILTKNLSDGNIGTITNNVEISQAYNSNGLKDTNAENNSSDAKIIIAVKTGTTITITFFVVAVIILIIIAFVLKNKKKFKIGSFILAICIIIFSASVVNAIEFTDSDGVTHYIPNFYDQYGANYYFNNPDTWGNAELYYKDLRFALYNGKWEERNADGEFICVSPGKHLGRDKCTGHIYWTYGGWGMDVGSEKFLNTYLTVYVDLDKDGDGVDDQKWVDFPQTFLEKNPSLSVTKGNTTIGASNESNGDKFMVGPFKYNYSSTDCSELSTSLSVKDGGTVIDYTIYNSAKNTILTSVPKNENFYLLVDSSVSTLNVDLKVSGTGTKKIEGVTRLQYYKFVHIEGKCYDTSGKLLADVSHIGWDANKDGIPNNIDVQNLVKMEHETKTENVNVSGSVSWSYTIPKGKITVNKKDTDSGAAISGAKIKVTGPNYSKEVTMNSGSYTFNNLLAGIYTIEETGAPSEYKWDLQIDKTKTATVTAGNIATVTINNRKYGNLKIQKTDEDTGDIIKEEGFTFKIYTLSGTTKNYISGYTSGNPSSLSYTTNVNAAKVFTTDKNGEIQLNNIPSYPKYHIQEVGVPTNLQGYYDVKDTADSVTVGNNTTTTKQVSNKQVYTNISGYVWEDKALENKDNTYNYLYKDVAEDTKDVMVSGITVRLKHIDGKTIQETTTDSEGNYKFTKVKISELGNYYVQFIYNGLKYTNITTNNTKDNGSKAIEIAKDRVDFNNTFAIITGGEEKGGRITLGYSRDKEGSLTNGLTYINGTYSSSLVQNTGYTISSANAYIKGNRNVVMFADTKTAEYSLNWIKGSKEITNINFGLVEREQPDMAIATDLDSLGLSINGYTHTYEYNKRLQATGIDIFSEVTKWNEENNLNENEYPKTYTRSIYNNYVYASGISGNGKIQDGLQVYLTYKIVVKNESSSVYMSANEIANYYDKTLDVVESWYEDNDGNKVNVTWAQKEETNDYNEMRTKSLQNEKIAAGESIIIYVKTKKNTVMNWTTQNEINEVARNVTEITAYSTYQNDGKGGYTCYAGIDKDSAPDNISVGTVDTYEDDTDSAPVVEITFDKPRTISGYVFEDYTSSEIMQAGERIGNGIYDDYDNGLVGNVKVELLNVSDNKAAYIYPNAVTETNFDAKEATCITVEDGKYEFAGILPGEYYLKFTYGDGSVIYKTTGETVNVTTQDYKSTIITSNEIKAAFGDNEFDKNPKWYQSNEIKGYSAAVDDYNTRKNINNKLSTITFEVKNDYENKTEEYANYQIMTARTPDINIAIENSNGEKTSQNEEGIDLTRVYDNINFGIVERPRQSIETTKEIKYIKLILSNGQVLAEGDPRDESNPIRYVIYPKGGSLKIEVDSEIIEGATLEVTYDIKIYNRSEVDYNTEKYYKYGDKSGASPVKMIINSVIDYMDEDLATSYTYEVSSGWKKVNAKGLKEDGLIAENVYNKVKTNNNILTNDCNLDLGIAGRVELEVTASKLLSTSKEMNYKNYAEVLKASNEVGRFYGQENEESVNDWKNITPGNLDPTSKESFEKDNNNDRRGELSIIPPTGENKNYYVIGSIIGIISLSVIAGGIILIKKKFLKE